MFRSAATPWKLTTRMWDINSGIKGRQINEGAEKKMQVVEPNREFHNAFTRLNLLQAIIVLFYAKGAAITTEIEGKARAIYMTTHLIGKLIIFNYEL